MSRSRRSLLLVAMCIGVLSTPMFFGFLFHGAWLALICPALNAAAVVVLVRAYRQMPEGSMLTIPRSAVNRGVLAIVAAVALVGLSCLLVEPVLSLYP